MLVAINKSKEQGFRPTKTIATVALAGIMGFGAAILQSSACAVTFALFENEIVGERSARQELARLSKINNKRWI